MKIIRRTVVVGYYIGRVLDNYIIGHGVANRVANFVAVL